MMVRKKVLPGTKVRGSDTGRPLNAVLDLLGRRQTLRILWELNEDSLTFRELQTRCGNLSPSLLNQRLRELRSALVIEHERGEGYRLTIHGRKLRRSLAPLYQWANDWGSLFGVKPK